MTINRNATSFPRRVQIFIDKSYLLESENNSHEYVNKVPSKDDRKGPLLATFAKSLRMRDGSFSFLTLSLGARRKQMVFERHEITAIVALATRARDLGYRGHAK